MTQTDHTHRSLFLVTLVVLAAAVGAVAVTGTAAAQDAGDETGGNTSAANATDESFYSPSADDPLNARFRDCCSQTVDSVSGGTLNLNIVYGEADGEYNVEISASGLSEGQIESITFDNPEDDTNNLTRTDIVGMDFSDVPAGEYEFTVSVVGADAETTVPLEVTGEGGAATETPSNESATNETAEEPTETGNETELGAGGTGTTDTSITAMPSTANTTANYTVSTTIGPDATGNLTQVTVNYRQSNASIGIISGNVRSATLGGQNITANATTATIGPFSRNLTINFDGTVQVSEGDRLNVTFGGMTNPVEPGTYTVGIRANNGTFDDATLNIAQNTTADNGTGAPAQMGNATGNTSITAMPNTANTTANYTVSTVAGPDATGNLTQVTVNYRQSNASIGIISGNVRSATLGGQNITANATTATIGPFSRNLTINFDGTVQVSEGDRLNITYGGMTNPVEPGTYTVGIRANNGTFDDATLRIAQNTTADNGTGQTTTTQTTTDGGTETTSTATGTGTAGGTAVATAVETVTGTGGGGGGGGQQGTEAGGPGFGVVVAVVALLAAALLAVRRN